MDREDIAYVINTTPKYFYLLPLHLILLERYLPIATCSWKFFLATEAPNDPQIRHLATRFHWLTILPLTPADSGFFESRSAAVKALPSSIRYVFPIQEDFLLERYPNQKAFQEAVEILDSYESVHSLRMMPCPGPAQGDEQFGETVWKVLDFQRDSYVFTYQATLWRRESYENYMNILIQYVETNYPSLTQEQKIHIAIKTNLAENSTGQTLLTNEGGLHLAWPRAGPQANAVYLSPWPYRPTAVVRGKLEPWAEELAHREGVGLEPSLR